MDVEWEDERLSVGNERISGFDISVEMQETIAVDNLESLTSGQLSSAFESQTPVAMANLSEAFGEEEDEVHQKPAKLNKQQIFIQKTLRSLRSLSEEVDATNWMYGDIRVTRS